MRVLIFLLIIFTITFQGCDILSPSDDKPIRVEIYENNCGYEPIQVLHLDHEQVIYINRPDSSNHYERSFYVYAYRNNYFTNIYYCEEGDSLEIFFDPAPQNMLSGVLIYDNYNISDHVMPNLEVNIYRDNVIIDTMCSDENGRFSVNLDYGAYSFRIADCDEQLYPELFTYNAGNRYIDLRVYSLIHAEKPNIYIYPKKETGLSVSLPLPKDSYITKSIPDYGDGWSVRVTPDGIIDGEYEYLFYECETKPFFQTQKGWICKKENLTDFFKKNLIQTGFEGREIDDFIEYWIPKLDKYPYYTIYPQYNNILDKHIPLEISEKPDNILRLHYVIRGMNHDNIAIVEPNIPVFNRSGFVVTEWGVIRLN